MNTSIRSLIVVALSVLSITTLAQAAIYSVPPSWSPMTMLNVSFNTTTNKLDVVDQATKSGPGVYPVLGIDTYSDPASTTTFARLNFATTTYGSYDPAQPWNVLNGTAFSRRMGWNPGSSTLSADIQAAYGAGAAIWIECISHSDGLESYLAIGKYGVNSAGTLDANNVPIIDPAANTYSGIFGTAGSSAKWKWDYLMDHNTYAISSQYITSFNQLFTADYRVYVGDAQGNDLAPSAASLETWTWQGPANVPEPTTLALLAVGAAFLKSRRNRKA